jgi:glutaredoxin
VKTPSRAASIGGLLALMLAATAAMQWWQGSSERRAYARLAALAQPGDIRMLSSESCAFCEAARRTMTTYRVRFDECFIERDADCKALYDATAARGTPTLLVRGQVQLGFSVQRVVGALEAPRGS